MKIVNAIFAVLVSALSCSAYARHPEPLVNYPAIPAVASSGVALTAEQLCQIVREVAEQKKWLVKVQPDGKLLASLSWESEKHAIVVEATCSPASYSVIYRDSVNMKFSNRDGQPEIHPYYNRFVKEMNDAVRVRLMAF